MVHSMKYEVAGGLDSEKVIKLYQALIELCPFKQAHDLGLKTDTYQSSLCIDGVFEGPWPSEEEDISLFTLHHNSSEIKIKADKYSPDDTSHVTMKLYRVGPEKVFEVKDTIESILLGNDNPLKEQ